MLESAIQKKIIDYLESQGCYVVNVVQAGKAGVPDILAVCPQASGAVLAVEVKRPGKKARPLQEYHLQKIREAGGVAIVATCVEDVERIFK
jgi:Holliday junction resolvase